MICGSSGRYLRHGARTQAISAKLSGLPRGHGWREVGCGRGGSGPFRVPHLRVHRGPVSAFHEVRSRGLTELHYCRHPRSSLPVGRLTQVKAAPRQTGLSHLVVFTYRQADRPPQRRDIGRVTKCEISSKNTPTPSPPRQFLCWLMSSRMPGRQSRGANEPTTKAENWLAKLLHDELSPWCKLAKPTARGSTLLRRPRSNYVMNRALQ